MYLQNSPSRFLVTLVANNLTVFISVLLLLSGCTNTGEPPIHPSGWLDTSSEFSHMSKIAESGIEGCKACHGGEELNDYFGGSSGVSCYGCHAGGPSGHPDWSKWMQDTTSVDFHGNRVEEKGTVHCMQCHGQDLKGGVSGVSCYVCHSSIPIYSGHPPESIWMDEENDQFHGEVAEEEGISYCQQCHGEDLEGGISGVACTTCHSNGFENGD